MITHFCTLPTVQAVWFEKICRELGISVVRVGDRIKTRCTPEDRKAAWELFNEEFKAKINHENSIIT